MIRRSANFIIVKEKSQLSNNKVTIAPCPMSSNGTSAFMLLHSGIEEVSELRGIKKNRSTNRHSKTEENIRAMLFRTSQSRLGSGSRPGKARRERRRRGGKKVEHISSREMKIGKIIQ
jgi:hypothetical protein